MSLVRVYIATTEGPSEVQRITEEDPEVKSVVCLDGKAVALPVSAGYELFVRQPTGIIEKYYGHGTFRLDVSRPISSGMSWQLGVLAAHALHAAGRLAGKGDTPDRVLWLTGEVDRDGVVGRVDHVAEKVQRAGELLTDLRAEGIPVTIMVPRDNQADVGAVPDNCRVLAAADVGDLFRAVDLRNPLRPSPSPPVQSKAEDEGGGRALAFVLVVLLVASSALAGAAWYTGYLKLPLPFGQPRSQPLSVPVPAKSTAEAPGSESPAPPPESEPESPSPPPEASEPTEPTEPTDSTALEHLTSPLISEPKPVSSPPPDDVPPPDDGPVDEPPVPEPEPEPAVESAPPPPPPDPSGETHQAASVSPPPSRPNSHPGETTLAITRQDLTLTAAEARIPRFHDCREIETGVVSPREEEVTRTGEDRFKDSVPSGLCWIEYRIKNDGPAAHVLIQVLPESGQRPLVQETDSATDTWLETGAAISLRVHVPRWRQDSVINRVVVVAGPTPLGTVRTRLAGLGAPAERDALEQQLRDKGLVVFSLSHRVGR